MVTRGAAGRSCAQSRSEHSSPAGMSDLAAQQRLVLTAVTRLVQQSASSHMPAEGVKVWQLPTVSGRPAIADQLLRYTF